MLNKDELTQLSADYRAGVSRLEIAKRLGCTRGVIAGNVNRLKLQRPNHYEVARANGTYTVSARFTRVEEDQSLSIPEQITAAHDRNIATPIITARPRKISPFDNLAARAKIADPPMVKYRPTKECCWPIGTPGTSNFRFCDAAHQNRTYCDDHQTLAHVPTPRLNMSGISR